MMPNEQFWHGVAYDDTSFGAIAKHRQIIPRIATGNGAIRGNIQLFS